jgi:heme-degrading monooxygenase HmoA
VAAFRRRLKLVDGFDGFRGLEVWRSDRDASEVIMVSRWQDRRCFRDYMRSAAHRASHDRIPDDLQAAIKLERLDLRALATEITEAHLADHPEDLERYGPAGREWCIHDNQHLLNWALVEVTGGVDSGAQVEWLAGVLRSRG